jgi:pimeloyl-ACP methyl ester carboxylesterase
MGISPLFRPQSASAGVEAGRARLLNEALVLTELRKLLADPVFAGAGVPDGEGQPVLVIPGFLAPDIAVRTMVNWLRRAGYFAAYPRAGPNYRCGEDAVRGIERRLAALAERQGRKVVIIGHSRGGQFARVLAVRRPDIVSTVVLLGTPGMDLAHLHPVVHIWMHGVSLLSRLGVPGVFASPCFTGSCCERFRADLEGPMPPGVRLVCVVGRRDGIVDRRACADHAATSVVQVDASHIGTTLNPATFRAIASVLARAEKSSQLSPLRQGFRPVSARLEVHTLRASRHRGRS